MNYPLTNMPSEAQTPALLDIDFQLSGALFETSWLAQLINTVWLLTGPFLALFLLYFSRDMALPLNVPIGFGWFFLLVVVPIAIQFAAGFRYGYRRQVRSRRLLFYPSEFIRRNLKSKKFYRGRFGRGYLCPLVGRTASGAKGIWKTTPYMATAFSIFAQAVVR